MSLVCQLWREAGDPLLWARGVLKVTGENMTAVVEALADSCRLQDVRKIGVEAEVSGELLEAVARHPGLRRLDMALGDLSLVQPELLAGALSRLEEVKMPSSGLTTLQAEALVTAVCEGGWMLKRLDFLGTNLSTVDARLLARAGTSLVEVNLSVTQLTQQQTKEIFTAVCAERSLLKTLNIAGNDLSSVEEGLLARAVDSLVEVNLDKTELTRQQIKEILTAICAGGSLLKTLNIDGNDLSSVEAGLLARAVNSLVEVKLDSIKLTLEQFKAVYTTQPARERTEGDIQLLRSLTAHGQRIVGGGE